MENCNRKINLLLNLSGRVVECNGTSQINYTRLKFVPKHCTCYIPPLFVCRCACICVVHLDEENETNPASHTLHGSQTFFLKGTKSINMSTKSDACLYTAYVCMCRCVCVCVHHPDSVGVLSNAKKPSDCG